MSYFVIITLMMTIFAILYVWYVTNGLKYAADNATLSLETDDDKLLSNWYEENNKETYQFNVNDLEIAVKYLQRVHDINVDQNLIVIGTDLEQYYHNITGKVLSRKFSTESNSLFDIRSNLGKNGEIAIIRDNNLRKRIQRKTKANLTEINQIMDNNLDIMARDYIRDTLKIRWNQINSLDDPNIINNDGSYLYIKENAKIEIGSHVTVIEKVTALVTPLGSRLNLLCTNLEFDSLITRWKKYLEIPSQTLSVR